MPGWGRSPGGGRGNPLQYSYPENPHGQRKLAGYSPWGRKESDTTEGPSTALLLWGLTVTEVVSSQGPLVSRQTQPKSRGGHREPCF